MSAFCANTPKASVRSSPSSDDATTEVKAGRLMKAVRFDRYGGVDVLEKRKVPHPVAAPTLMTATPAPGRW
jgi:hypothetical protein